MTRKEEYIEFCKTNDVSLFAQPTWCDATGIEWDVLLAKHNQTTAYFVYFIEKRFGFKLVRNPHLTPYTFITFKKNVVEESLKKELIEKILQQIPQHASINLDVLIPYTQDGLLKFSNSPRITNLLKLDSLEEVYSNFKPALKRQLKKAEKNITIIELDDIELMYKMHSKTFLKHDAKPSIPLSAFTSIWACCKQNNKGKLLFSKDTEGNIHAGLWLVYDVNKAYYLVGGTDAHFYGSGAMSYLMWHAIQQSKALNKKVFDFEGSMIPNVNRFFKNFGPDEFCYLNIKQTNSSVYSILKKIKP